MIKEMYDNAILAAAAYAKWDAPINEVKAKLIGELGVTSLQYDTLFDPIDGLYEVYNGPASGFIELPNGFSATVFKNRDTQEITVAFRGTDQLTVDTLTTTLDVVLQGAGFANDINLFLGQQNVISDFLVDAGVDVNGSLAGSVSFTGHSLGGFLATIAAYKYHASVDQAYTFNGLGVGLDDYLGYEILGGISLEGKVQNYYADLVGSVVGYHPGSKTRLFVEEEGLVADHFISKLVESLSVYRVLAQLDPQLDTQDGIESIYGLLEGVSHTAKDTLESTVDGLGDFLGADLALQAVKDDVESFYQKLVNRGTNHSLSNPLEVDVAAGAAQDTEAGRGLRYTALHLSPFAVTSSLNQTAAAAADYAHTDPQGGLVYTTRFLADRAAMLKASLQRNVEDTPHPDAIAGEKIRFHDATAGEVFAGANSTGQGGSNTVDPDTVRNILFGDNQGNTISGKSRDDSLYGMAGDDQLEGASGHDYIEGGPGDDTIVGGAGDDRLMGGRGSDRFHWSDGDGHDLIGDYDDGGDRIIVNGVDLSTLRFLPVTPGSSLFKDSAVPDLALHYDGSFMSLSIGHGNTVGSITATQYSPATGQDYGIVLSTPELVPPVTQLAVSQVGTGDTQVDASAFWRQSAGQGGYDWSTVSISFSAADVSNYTGDNKPYGLLSPSFEGGPQGDHLAGDDASNQLIGLAGDDLIEGGSGADYLAGYGGSDRLLGGTGNDLLFGAARYDIEAGLQTGSAQDNYYLAQIDEAPEDSNVLDGGTGADVLSGGESGDSILGGDGADYLLGGAGNDYLSGGEERDIIYGDSAMAVSYSGSEGQSIQGALQIAFADAGASSYDDVIYAGPGSDTVWGELGADVIHGGNGDDDLIGDRYHDAGYFGLELPAYAGTSPELASLLHGDDRLFGDSGSDMLSGLGGNDYLHGGSGDDLLRGGLGDDVYMLKPGDGLDSIDDDLGSHTLVFSGFNLSDLQVVFRNGQVTVSSATTGDGFSFSGDQWGQTRIAMNSADSLIERSQLDAHYLDLNGHLLLTTIGSDAYSEAERDRFFTLDEGGFGPPILTFGPDADAVEITATGGQSGARLAFPGVAINPLVQISPLLLDTQWAFIESMDNVALRLTGFVDGPGGTPGHDTIIGTLADDTLAGGAGDDLLQGEAGNDSLDGGTGGDLLLGGRGADVLYGGAGHDNDILQGGPGNDVLDGAYSNDTYRFSLGDGQDVITDAQGYHAFEFDSSVNPDDVALYYTGTGPAGFRLQYSAADWVMSAGETSVQRIDAIRVEGAPVSLIQRADITDATFYDTRMNDVFESGGGNDVIHASGQGYDVFRVAAGDGNDTIMLDEGYYPDLLGEIRFADHSDLSFSFSGIDAHIAFVGGELSLEAEKHFSDAARDNALNRFLLASESDPHWLPEIVADGPGWLSGSFGTDRLLGSADFDVITPGYGHDVILSGGGNDSIFLNDVYFNVNQAGVGHKMLVPGRGDDYIETPLYQGMTLHYDLGDGHDRVVYDWSYGDRHPYQFSLLQNGTQPVFSPYGEDSLVLGHGIDLERLALVRNENTLLIATVDQPGSLLFENFFDVYKPQNVVGRTGLLDPFSGEDSDGYRLSVADIDALFPRTPLQVIELADGSSHSLESLLSSRMLTDVTVEQGTVEENLIETDQSDDLILAHGGNDMIIDTGGENTIYAGEGDDEVLLQGGASRLDAGGGDDLVNLRGGSLEIEFGNSGGADTVTYVPGQTALDVYLDEVIAQEDLSFSVTDGLHGQGITMTLVDSDASLEMVALSYNPLHDAYEPELDEVSAEIHFGNGARLSGHQLLAMVWDEDGDGVGEGDDDGEDDAITGTSTNDKLFGTEANDVFIASGGNDVLEGFEGDDLFVFAGQENGADKVSGGEGVDTIQGSDEADRIGLKRLVRSDSIELIDGLAGEDLIVGNAGKNRLDFSATDLVGITRIEAGAGNDFLKGSAGDDVLVGGAGNDKVFGLGGDDEFRFSSGDGRDTLINKDGNSESVDVLTLSDIEFDELWLSRSDKHLVIDVVGSNDQIKVNNWFAGQKHRLDRIDVGDRALYANQVDGLVDAMASFGVVYGEASVIPQEVQNTLEPILSSAWEVAG